MITLLRHWIVYLLALCGFGAFAINYTAWFSTFLFYLVLALPLFSIIMTLPPLLSLRLSFSLPANVHRGDDAELRIMAKGAYCPYYLPITLMVSQMCVGCEAPRKKRVRYKFAPYPVYMRAKRFPFLWIPHAAGGIRIPIDTAHTAVIRTEILSATVYDFLGLFAIHLYAGPRLRKLCLFRSRNAADFYRDVTVLPHTTAPRGRLRMWDNSSSARVPTQRFSEQYEIRDYRPGDALRSVHWKLTAKIDDILVREPVEPNCRVLAITVERPAAGMYDDTDSAADHVYDALDWMLRALCVRDHVQSVVVAWVTDPGRACTETIYDLEHLDDFYRRILSDPVPEITPPYAFASVYKNVDRGYHLNAQTCGIPAKE